MKLFNIQYLTPACKGIFPRITIIVLLACGLMLQNSRAQSQCKDAPSMAFTNPVLISGVDGQVGALYLFANVAPGLDAQVQITALHGGALLGEIDNTTQGYFDAWQPYVTAGVNDTSYLDWHICFKKAGTNIDSVLSCLAITSVDTDGDALELREFIEAATPGAYAVDPNTKLSVTFDGVRNRAIGSYDIVDYIDTAHKEAMFQMNFANVSCIDYRNGSISTRSTIDVRHTCIYFKPFFYDNIFVILPCKLLSFQATDAGHVTHLTWSAIQENNLLYYTVQKSNDGISWKNIERIDPPDQGSGTHTYHSNDPEKRSGVTYYRLQQTDRKGNNTYSYIIHTGVDGTGILIKCATIAHKTLPMEIRSAVRDNYTVSIHSLQGQLIRRQQFNILPGINNISVSIPPSAAGAVYIVNITNKDLHLVYTTKVLVY